MVNSKLQEERIVDMDSFLTLLGIWIAEGWTNERNNTYYIYISSNKQRVKDALSIALPKLGYSYRDENNKIVISNKQLWTFLDKYSLGAPNKKLPEWVMDLSVKQTQLLIESMVLGDGTYLKNKEHYAYYTSSQKLADQFQQLCLHAGWSSNISIHHHAGNTTFIDGREVVSNHDLLRLSVIKTKNNPSVNHSHSKKQKVQEESVYDYEGEVYCLTVPNEIFYVRKNGIPVWTGNSRSSGPYQLLTRQPAEGRAKDGGLRLGEMERDAELAHGAVQFLKERMFDVSDKYFVSIDKKTGMIAPVNKEKDIYKSLYSDNTTDFVRVQIPYATKLFLQELYTMGITTKLYTGNEDKKI